MRDAVSAAQLVSMNRCIVSAGAEPGTLDFSCLADQIGHGAGAWVRGLLPVFKWQIVDQSGIGAHSCFRTSPGLVEPV